jgi:hypothetical protein
MEEHLHHLLDDHPDYAKRAARTRCTNDGIRTPNGVWEHLRQSYRSSAFPLYYEKAKYSNFVSEAVQDIYCAITGKSLEVDEQKRATRGTVIADTVFELNNEIKILWEDKAPKVFDKIIGDFIDEARAHGSVITPFLDPQSSRPSSTKQSETKQSSSKQSPSKQPSPKASPKRPSSKQSSSKKSSTTYSNFEAIIGKVRLVLAL